MRVWLLLSAASAINTSSKTRPDIVTKYAIFTLVLGIIAIIIGALEIIYVPSIAVIGVISIVIGAYAFVCGLGTFTGQK